MTIHVIGCYTPALGEGGFHTEAEQRAETRRMKAAARASRRATWPPVPNGYGPPAAHLRRVHDPAVANHPLGWVNAALSLAWRRFYALEQRRKGNTGNTFIGEGACDTP